MLLLKDLILNHKFTEWQLDRIRLDFSKGDDKTQKLFYGIKSDI